MRALVPPTLVCTTLRTDRPAMPNVSVPGSAPAGEADQEPTQMPVEAGAAELCGARPPARVFLLSLPSPAATPTYMATERPTITAMIAQSKALYLMGAVDICCCAAGPTPPT